MPASDLLEPLEKQRTGTLALLDALTDEQINAVHEGSGWTVGQVLAHIARSELGEAFFVRQAQAGQVIDMSLVERDGFNADGATESENWNAERLRAEFKDARDTLREAFGELDEADLDKPIKWPEWTAENIRDSIPFMVGHEDEHVAMVRTALDQPTGSTS